MIYGCSGNMARVSEWTYLIWLQNNHDDIRALYTTWLCMSNSLGHLLSGVRG